MLFVLLEDIKFHLKLKSKYGFGNKQMKFNEKKKKNSGK